jgi:hypothetical protein
VVNWTATDLAGNSSSCSFLVIVLDTQPPAISCPTNITVGTDAGKPTAVVNFTVNATDNCDGAFVATSVPPAGTAFPIGTNTVVATAVDSSGNSNTCSFTVTVRDTAPPVVTVIASPNILWPPNHEIILVTITVVGTDNSGTFTSKITSVTSSDPTNTTGDGNTGGDWLVVGPLTVDLRAERASQSVGRTYTITVQSTDPYGNAVNSTVTVTVPPSQ